jgi:hypothetical protein
MVSGGAHMFSTSYTVKHIHEDGTVGLVQHDGNEPQLFDNFVVSDGAGKTVAKDQFEGSDGTVPPHWKYIAGGPNLIKPGLAAKIDAIAWHPIVEPNAAYFSSVREFQKRCRELGFKGEFFATEIYSESMYPPGPPRTWTETEMAKQYAKSLVGHNGLGMEAGSCHPYLTSYAHPVALCQPTWPTQTLNPCRPTMGYYMWRTIATVMDDFRSADFPVRFSKENELLSFTFQRGDGERMVSVWIDAPRKDGIIQQSTGIIFPGIKAQRAAAVDVMNGTEQELNFEASGSDTVLKGILIKDYPVFIKIGQ